MFRLRLFYVISGIFISLGILTLFLLKNSEYLFVRLDKDQEPAMYFRFSDKIIRARPSNQIYYSFYRAQDQNEAELFYFSKEALLLTEASKSIKIEGQTLVPLNEPVNLNPLSEDPEKKMINQKLSLTDNSLEQKQHESSFQKEVDQQSQVLDGKMSRNDQENIEIYKNKKILLVYNTAKKVNLSQFGICKRNCELNVSCKLGPIQKFNYEPGQKFDFEKEIKNDKQEICELKIKNDTDEFQNHIEIVSLDSSVEPLKVAIQESWVVLFLQ